MNRVRGQFRRRTQDEGRLFMPYLCAGDPDLETTERILRNLESWGADAVELGIPFSDPLADGPTLQRASTRSLENGFSIEDYFSMLERVRPDVEIPVVVMTYYNPVFRWGDDRFLSRARDAGADGILAVDLPPEESPEFFDRAGHHDLATVLLATPTTPLDRVRDLSRKATGFLYYVNVTGVTGAREGFSDRLRERLRDVAGASDLPVAMGFGVSDTSDLGDLLGPVDGVIVGSALADVIERHGGASDRLLSGLESKVRELADPLHGRKGVHS